ncbi:hypothetical protein IWX78_003091 [Mycetocola sp. CAN_C7]
MPPKASNAPTNLKANRPLLVDGMFLPLHIELLRKKSLSFQSSGTAQLVQIPSAQVMSD